MKRLESLSGLLDLPFPHYDNPPAAPFEILRSWLDRAHQGDVREPDAYTLATRNETGDISMRTIFPVRFNGEELWFATHSCSRKSLDILANQAVGCHIYWRELGRQLTLMGCAERLPDCVADEVWQARSSAYDPVSIASYQSEPLIDMDELLVDVARLESRGKLPRPERFVVWQFTFHSCEFWSASASRIHKRLLYTRSAQGWEHARLQP